ncbi:MULTISPECIES: glycosyltransferase family 4 protein [unclassified Burkholderia]|uniref:glycosyltransferase family 4 protein n=1 Tax=unclassified Burkholderia TaxID=2613784 RepID=UPI000F56915F|nr:MULTISPECIES: glycosyltransferase family 4 protein [unclassified Burkholderia]RQR30797.1 glycosyltransferase [Burkholderia sp. Bp9131]RQR63681.1 glycosyltransferase [Burkholderia sp. Bp9015]RQR73526.1 glycosyltransferase [Burkholderia sp. Bp9011]RQR85216.1 glycosyltransferase [Burkholderia sp. Bp9010]RQR96484.1 glycosyltransferase [Burkholderia sp. Bp8991]
MKVLFLIGSVGDYHTARLKDLEDRLSRERISLGVLIMSCNSGDYLHREYKNSENDARERNWRYLDEGGRQRGRVKFVARLLDEISREAPDLIVTIGYNFSYSCIGLIYRLFKRNARIIFCADSKFDDGLRRPSREVLKALLARMYDGAIVAGRRQSYYFQFLGIPGENIRIGYDVVDNDVFMRAAAAARQREAEHRAQLELPEKYIVCVSRLIARKRVDRVIDTYARSQARDKGVFLVIIGSGELEQELRARCDRQGLADWVIFRKVVPNRDMPIFLSLARFLMLLSDYDQWGLCLNEALACGTPVLCTDRCGAAHELVRHGENGFVTDGTESDIDLGVSTLLDDDILIKLKSCYPWNLHDWNLQRFSENVLNFAKGLSK